MRTVLFVALASMLWVSCSKKTPFPMDREWKLAAMNGKNMSGENAFSLNFNASEKAYSGRACNNYRGTYDIKGSKLTFSQPASTKMMCPNISEENEYMKTLSTVDGYRFSGNSLYLTSGGSDVLLYK